MAKKKWIQGAVHPEHEGALHRALGVPEDKKIPQKTLEEAAHRPGITGQRARFALNVRGLHHGQERTKK